MRKFEEAVVKCKWKELNRIKKRGKQMIYLGIWNIIQYILTANALENKFIEQ